MVASLPSRIMNYNVSSSCPTDELLTIGQILSEVGDYASTILDQEHISMSRKCMAKLEKVVRELVSRKCIKSETNLYDMPQSCPIGTDLGNLTISELYNLYRCWPIRHKAREKEGMETLTFYYEGRIVREMKSRKAVTKEEQLKIDYCVTSYHNELDNMSFVLSRPIQINNEKIYPDITRNYSPDELVALIRLYTDYRDILEREILVEYVDFALDLISHGIEETPNLELISEVVELGRRKIVNIPKMVNQKLEKEITRSSSASGAGDLALAMLTLQIINNDVSLERKAKRILNRCYKSAFNSDNNLCNRISDLHSSVTCCDYVTHFNVRKSAMLWNDISRIALSSGMEVAPSHIFQMLEIAKECEDYSSISNESKDKWKQMLNEMAQSGSLEARAYGKISNISF